MVSIALKDLPEEWSGYNMDKTTFTLSGKMPRVPDNVQLHPGWFEKSLPKWLNEHPGPIGFMHIDCDLYSSTKAIFDQLAERLRPDTIIIFDEYFGYPNWRNHEFKAFQEFVAQYHVRYEYVVYSRNQVAVRLLAIDGAKHSAH